VDFSLSLNLGKQKEKEILVSIYLAAIKGNFSICVESIPYEDEMDGKQTKLSQCSDNKTITFSNTDPGFQYIGKYKVTVSPKSSKGLTIAHLEDQEYSFAIGYSVLGGSHKPCS